MTYLKNNNIDKDIHQKLRKKYVYETYMHNIYNLIVGQTNDKLQEIESLDATFQAVKSGQDLIGYLIILKNLCLSKQSEQHPIRPLYLATKWLYNNIQNSNKNTTYFLFSFHYSDKVKK